MQVFFDSNTNSGMARIPGFNAGRPCATARHQPIGLRAAGKQYTLA